MGASKVSEIPFFEFAPGVDCGDPPFGGGVFGENSIRLKTFDLQNEMDTVCESVV